MSFTQSTRKKKRFGRLKEKVLKLRAYQNKALKFLLANVTSGLFLDPGRGKTVIILTMFKILKKLSPNKTMLVISKKKIIYNVWPEQIEEWSFPFSYQILHGNKKDKALRTKSDVYLLNFDGLEWLLDQLKENKKLRNMFDYCVIDESSKIKNMQTNRYRYLWQLLSKYNTFERRHIMTGTPCPNTLIDLYAQIKFLDLGEALGRKTKFKNDFFTPCGYMGYDLKPIPDAEKKIFKQIKHLVIRVDSKSLKIPKLSVIDYDVALPKKAARLYKGMFDDFIIEVKEGTVTASNAATKTSKLRQIANGTVYDEDGKPIRVHDEKLDACLDIVDELNGKPVLIGYEFNHDLTLLQKVFPDAPVIGGKTKDIDLNIIIRDWNAGRTHVVLAQISAAAHGLNLQKVDSAIILFGLTWNLEDYLQFLQRVWRSGNTAAYVNCYRLLATNTIDQVVAERLAQKDATQSKLLKALVQMAA